MTNIGPFRVFILGAGFSKPAGLPLGGGLSNEIIQRIRNEYPKESIVARDLDRFRTYKGGTRSTPIPDEAVDFEEFMAFLDVEHFLSFRGSDTWLDSGNESQLVIRRMIADTIARNTPSPDSAEVAVHREFARRLQPDDIILTFNYDTLLEDCLDLVEVPYRLFQDRLSNVSGDYGSIDTSVDEVVVLKLHGSIDWFYAAGEWEKEVFSVPGDFRPTPIIDCPYFEGSELTRVYRVPKIGSFLEAHKGWTAPMILAPSFNKLLYADAVRELWHGIYRAGVGNGSLGIIGYSMPEHDNYARQAIYHVVRNFQECDPGFEGFNKAEICIVDFQREDTCVEMFRNQYSFVDWDHAVGLFDGFSIDTIESLFPPV